MEGLLSMSFEKIYRKPWINVKALRLSRGWCQAETAERLGIGRAHLSMLENDKCGFSAKVIDAVIRVFNVKYENFYTDDNNNPEGTPVRCV